MENNELMQRDVHLEALAATFAHIAVRGAASDELRRLSRWRREIYWLGTPTGIDLPAALARLRATYTSSPAAADALALIWALLTLEPVSEPLRPTLYLLGGLPGSGKAALIKRLGLSPLIINGDETRYFHPQLAQFGAGLAVQTQRWAGEMVGRLRDRALAAGQSVVIEGTFRTSRVPLAELERFKAAGYHTRILIAGCNRATAWANAEWRGAALRELGLPPRLVAREHFAQTAAALAANVATVWASGLADELRLYQDGRIVWHSDFSNPGTIAEQLTTILNGPPLPPLRAGEILSPVEQFDLRRDFAESSALMRKLLAAKN